MRLVRIATEKVKPNLFEVDLTDPAISVRGEALVQPHVQLAISFVLGWKLSNHHSYREVAVAAFFSRCTTTGLARAPKGADIGVGHSCFELAARSLNLILVQDFRIQYLNKEPGSLCCLCTWTDEAPLAWLKGKDEGPVKQAKHSGDS